MPLVFTETEARFEDVCTVEDALPLLEFLKNSEAPAGRSFGLHVSPHGAAATPADRAAQDCSTSRRSQPCALGGAVAEPTSAPAGGRGPAI